MLILAPSEIEQAVSGDRFLRHDHSFAFTNGELQEEILRPQQAAASTCSE
jgi:hypothetical protein